MLLVLSTLPTDEETGPGTGPVKVTQHRGWSWNSGGAWEPEPVLHCLFPASFLKMGTIWEP